MTIIKFDLIVDESEVRSIITEQLNSYIRSIFIFWDLEEMMKQTCMGKTFLETEFLQDPRMKILERRKEKGKRYWLYKESIEVMQEIMNEW